MQECLEYFGFDKTYEIEEIKTPIDVRQFSFDVYRTKLITKQVYSQQCMFFFSLCLQTGLFNSININSRTATFDFIGNAQQLEKFMSATVSKFKKLSKELGD